MADETKAVDEFLGDLKNDSNQDPFVSPAVQEEEQKTEEVAEKEEKLPFHKDPKVQKYIEREIAKRIPAPTVSEEKTDDTTDIDEVLTRIIGNDTPEKISAVKDFKRILLEREDRGAEKALQEIQQERQEELKAEQEAEEALNNGFEAIEEETGLDITSSAPQAKKLRGQFIDFVKKVAPKDEDGEISELPDLEETFKIFQSTRTKVNPTTRAKDLASRSTDRGDSTTVTPQERRDWSFVEKMFSKLTD